MSEVRNLNDHVTRLKTRYAEPGGKHLSGYVTR